MNDDVRLIPCQRCGGDGFVEVNTYLHERDTGAPIYAAEPCGCDGGLEEVEVEEITEDEFQHFCEEIPAP